jgi:hypothetical protein
VHPNDRKPPLWQVVASLVLAVLLMTVAVYFGGTGRTGAAMIGTALFVLLGGLGFELARRRSL